MTKETCTLTKTNKLVDLNGDFANFETTFSCRSKDGKDFDFLVVDQTKLDSEPTLDFKKTNGGTVAATVRSETNIYQNHFLVLKSATPTEVDIEYNVRELPKVVETRQNPSQNPSQDPRQNPSQNPSQDAYPSMQAYTDQDHMETYSQHSSHHQQSSSIKMYLFIGLLIAGVVSVFFFFKRKNASSDVKVDVVETLSTTNTPPSEPAPTYQNTPITEPAIVPAPVLSNIAEASPQSDFSLGRRINERLIEKLKTSNRYM